MIEVRCQCGALLQLGDEWSGRKGKCPRCGAVRIIARSARLDAAEHSEAEHSAESIAASSSIVPNPPPVTHPETSTPVTWSNDAAISAHAPAPTNRMRSGPNKAASESAPQRTSPPGRKRFLMIAGSVGAICLVLGFVYGIIQFRRATNEAEEPSTAASTVTESPLNRASAQVAAIENPTPSQAHNPAPTPANSKSITVTNHAPESPNEQLPDDGKATGAPDGNRSIATTQRPSRNNRAPGMSGASRQFDDFHCVRVQQQYGVRIPAAATILEVDGEVLPLADTLGIHSTRAPILLLPRGEHLIRFRPGERLIRVSIDAHFATIYQEMREFFNASASVRMDELRSRSARAMDVHGAPFLLNFMGAAYASQGKWEAAERKFRRALQVNATFSPAHLNLAHCLLQRKRVEESIMEVSLADAFNIQNVYGLSDAIHEFRRTHHVPEAEASPLPLNVRSYVSLESMGEEDDRLVAVLESLSRYAIREEERGKILNNIGVHFSESNRPELALKHYRGALEALKSAGPERFALARQILTQMQKTCRRAGFDEAEEYAFMEQSVLP